MAENSKNQNPDLEQMKEALRIGGTLLAAGGRLLFKKASETVAKVREEFDPNVKFGREMKEMYDNLIAAGVRPEVAEDTVMKEVQARVKDVLAEPGDVKAPEGRDADSTHAEK